MVTFGEPLGHVIILRGQILVNSTDDDPHPRRRVSIQNVPVCTFKTSPCMPAPRTCDSTCARGAGIHGNVLDGHTGFFSVSHHTPHHTPHRTHHNTRHNTTQQHDHNTTRRERQRQRETETERDRDRKRRQGQREKKRRQRRDKRREDKRRQNKTR